MRTRAYALLALLAAVWPAGADVPRLLGYQGRLLRADGTAATGTASVTFAVCDAPTGGSVLWQESQTLGLSDGYYATFLGLVSAPPDGLFDGAGRWLELRVGSEALSPRQQLAPVPYAVTAQNVAGGSAIVSSLKVGSQTIVDASGRLAGSARYAAGAGIAIDDASQTVSLSPCAAGEILVRDATGWTCAGTVLSVSAAAPLAVSGSSAAPQVSLPRAAANASGYLASSDWSLFDAKYDASSQCGGDLSGTLSSPVVVRLQSRPVAAAQPSAGQVLKWNAVSSQWEPSADFDSGGTVRNVTVSAPLTAYAGSTTPSISIAAASASIDGYLSSSDWSRFDAKYDSSTQCVGDLAGSFGNPQVAKIQGVAVSTTVPSNAQVMRFDGAHWAPASLGIADVGGLSAGYVDLNTAQTIAGAKTFTTAPAFSAPLGTASGGTGATTAAANAFFAGPASGASGAAPAFRGLVSDDVPSLDAGKIASGTFGTVRGGTGTTAAAPHAIFAGPSSGSAADAPAFRALAASDLPALDTSMLVGGTLDVSRGGTGATSTGANMVFAGPDSATGAPGFRNLAAADIPTGISITGSAGSVPWSGVGDRPTTLAGYGITDAFPANGTLAGLVRSTASGVSYFTGGSLGVGTTAPAVALDVAGGIRPGNQTQATVCDATTEGTLRYNTTSKVVEYCNGAVWNAISNVGTPPPFSFTNQTCVAASGTVTSNTIALTGAGFTGPVMATCGAGCTGISRNGGAFAPGPVGGFVNGDTIAIQTTSASGALAAATATVTVGTTISGTWTVTTSPAHGLSTFTSGSGTWTAPACYTTVEVLVVAGGGGGGGQVGGGGGGGGVIHQNYTVVSGNNYSYTVGAGGAGGAIEGSFGQQSGATGADSIFGSLTAKGGGGGGGYSNTVGARTGGSGGGGGGTGTAGAAGTAGQGTAGGTGTANSWAGGGGGGAGAAGANAGSNVGGKGGDGLPFNITGTNVYYGGGGGGCSQSGNAGAAGGLGGGGTGGANNGSTETTRVTAGTANTGGGGGGARDFDILGRFNTQGSAGAGAGGSGIVVVKW